MAAEWISAAEAADILGVSKQTVIRSLTDEDARTVEWGAAGQGWRPRPLARRREYQLRRSWVLAKSEGRHPNG